MKFQLPNFGLILTETYFMASEVLEHSAQLIWTTFIVHYLTDLGHYMLLLYGSMCKLITSNVFHRRQTVIRVGNNISGSK